MKHRVKGDMMKKIAVMFFMVFTLLFAQSDLTEQEMEAQIKALQKSLQAKKEAKEKAQVTQAIQKPVKSYFYMGYEIGLGGGKYTKKTTVTEGNTTATSTELGAGMSTLKFGYSNSSNNRWELSFSGIATERINKIEDTLSGMDLNWYAVFDIQKSRVSPYIMIGLGHYVWEDTAATYGEDLKGGAFNLGIGGIYKYENSFEFEFAYKLKGIGWQEYISGTTITNQGHGFGFLCFGFNYRF